MPRTCTIEQCDRDLYAKGMCNMHYKRTRPRTPDKPEMVACCICGTTVARTPRKRALGATCSYECRRILTFGERCDIPADHPARWYGKTCTWAPPKRETQQGFQVGQCADCAATIVEPAAQTPSEYCTLTCRKRSAKRRRRAREHGAPGDFTLNQLILQYIRQGKACAYCDTAVDGIPDPDHVLPLSRGGRNDMSNIVACCRACNTDKNDLTLDEWRQHRASYGKEPRRTSLTGTAYRHLTHQVPTAPAWRYTKAA